MKFKDKVDKDGNIIVKDGILVEIEPDRPGEIVNGVVNIPDHVVEIAGYLIPYERQIRAKLSIDDNDGYADKITKISIPENAESIGHSAFHGLRKLREIEFRGKSKLKTISTNAFRDCESLSNVKIPEGVKVIYANVFKGCSNLRELQTPVNSIIVVTDSYFEGISYLEKLNIQGEVAYIEEYGGETNIDSYTRKITDYAEFSKSIGYGNRCFIKEIIIPQGVTRIGNYAFYRFTNMERIIIPDYVTEIGEGAFADCKKLTEVKIPNSVKRIERGTFSGCESLVKIKIPDGVVEMGNGAVSGCSSLTNIEIPDSITQLGTGVFRAMLST